MSFINLFIYFDTFIRFTLEVGNVSKLVYVDNLKAQLKGATLK